MRPVANKKVLVLWSLACVAVLLYIPLVQAYLDSEYRWRLVDEIRAITKEKGPRFRHVYTSTTPGSVVLTGHIRSEEEVEQLRLTIIERLGEDAVNRCVRIKITVVPPGVAPMRGSGSDEDFWTTMDRNYR